MFAASTIEKRLIKHSAYMSSPINGSIELLPLCNMNCDMCYVRLNRQEMESQGRLRTAEELLSLGRQMQEAGTLFLLLTGGEPLLHPDFKEIYLGFRRLGMLLTINTNGTLIDTEWADFFAKYPPRRINITLYGANERAYTELCHFPGGFERVISAIQLLRSRDIDVKISCSLTNVNRQDLDFLYNLGAQLDVPVFTDTYMVPATRERSKPFAEQSRLNPSAAAQAEFHILQKELNKQQLTAYVKEILEKIKCNKRETPFPRSMTCLAGSCSFTINWQGMMRPCVILCEPQAPVFEMGFDACWKYIREETEKMLLNTDCAECRLRPICNVCVASVRMETGSYDGTPEYLCQYARELERLFRSYIAENQK